MKEWLLRPRAGPWGGAKDHAVVGEAARESLDAREADHIAAPPVEPI